MNLDSGGGPSPDKSNLRGCKLLGTFEAPRLPMLFGVLEAIGTCCTCFVGHSTVTGVICGQSF